jgi:hypothetical protein
MTQHFQTNVQILNCLNHRECQTKLKDQCYHHDVLLSQCRIYGGWACLDR